ncbi:type-F conjugative transfer system pilin assembly thiol-disulfide isomerase TrbB [Salmonella enterica subsp. enterica serovar Give]|nr:type-F conjugative transfer system pilin assembly thiol-disulfide isomerase TrbB [Salmonella enterica subsp. enterica serovar Give]
MWKQVLTGLLLVAACVQASSTLEELRQLEAHKTTPGKASQIQTAATSLSPVAPAVPERRDYRLPDGRVVNLKNYKLVLFMQSRCGYCQQFDPLLKRVTAQMGLDVFPYTLDGMGDASFPDAIPATEAVIRDMWSNMRPVTPAAFLVEVNTLKTMPLLYGIVDEQTLRQRIDEALGFAVSAKGKYEIMKNKNKHSSET